MPPLDPDARPQLSVLDRLFDDQLKEKQEVPPNRFQAARQYKLAVLRDLEWLLNSRANPEAATEGFPELQSSGYSYGLAELPAGDPIRLKQAIKEVIERHEPRLTDILIESEKDDDKLSMNKMKMKLNFKVSAWLKMAPAPEQIAFDTELDTNRGSYQVKGD